MKMLSKLLPVYLFFLLASSSGAFAQPTADLILSNAKVWTGAAHAPWAEAVAIRGEHIVYVGSTQGAAQFEGAQTQRFDLNQRLVLPGFNDAHIHLMSGALSLERVDLIEAQSVAEAQAHIRAFVAAHPDNEWVLGRGWLYGAFPGGLPTKAQLDAVVADRPAYMECYDGHSGWANTAALKAAGITKSTPDPRNGEIVRDPQTGEPTGALKEAATALIDAIIPLPNEEQRYQLLLRALQALNSQGITSAQDAGYSPQEIDATMKLFERARGEGKLTVRLTVSVSMEQNDFAQAITAAQRLAESHHDTWLRCGVVKGFVDGVIEAHTAAMLAPYSDDAAFGRGEPNWDDEHLQQAVLAADKNGLQIYLHAIGDAGVRMALDAYAVALAANGPRDRRGRIEHIETIAPKDYVRFKALGVIASMQPLHADPNQNIFEVWARNAGPERSTRAFSWRNFEKADATLVFGSDWPVVTAEVLRGWYCAVTRKTKAGLPMNAWHPELAVSLESALRHYTSDAAYASFEEKEKGTLAPGKLADVVVISENLFAAPPEAMLRAKILVTIMNGKIVYREAK